MLDAFTCLIDNAGLYAEILQRRANLGYIKYGGGGGAAARSIRGNTGRHCLKISKGGEILYKGGKPLPQPPQYTPVMD